MTAPLKVEETSSPEAEVSNRTSQVDNTATAHMLLGDYQSREWFAAVQEVGTAVTDLIRQTIFLMFLVLQSYLIPLSYLCWRFGAPKGIAYPPTHETCISTSHKQGCTGCGTEAANKNFVVAVWHLVVNGVISSYRTARLLFLLLKLLEQEQDILRFTHRCRDLNDFRQKLFQRSTWPSIPNVSTALDQQREEQPPPTASQVYHASLTGNGQLDNVLAVLENESSSSSDSGPETVARTVEPIPVQKHDGKLNSIQTTPERLLRSHTLSSMEGKINEIAGQIPDQGSDESVDKNDVPYVKDNVKLEEIETIGGQQPSLTQRTTCAQEIKLSCSRTRKLCKMCPDLPERCPTCVTRTAGSQALKKALTFQPELGSKSSEDQSLMSAKAVRTPRKLQRRLGTGLSTRLSNMSF